MKQLLITLTRDEQAISIVELFLFLFAAVMVYAMVSDYMTHLENHGNAECGVRDFLRRERLFIFLFLGMATVTLVGLAVCLLATGDTQ